MVIKISFYGLKSSGAAFRAKFASLLQYIRYTPYKSDPDICMIPEIKSDGTEYYEHTLVYVDNLLVFSFVPIKGIKGIKFVFKINGDKTEPPIMYLGVSLKKVETKGGTKC